MCSSIGVFFLLCRCYVCLLCEMVGFGVICLLEIFVGFWKIVGVFYGG